MVRSVSPGYHRDVQTVLHGTDGDAIVVDETHFPVVIATWYGAASPASVRAYYDWLGRMLERAVAARRTLVNIVDSAPAGVPSAEVRRLISELTLVWEKQGANDTTVRAFVVIESAAIRGVINVLNWLHGGMKSVNVASLDDAVQSGLGALADAGEPVPPGFAVGRVARPPRPTVR